MPKPNRLGEVPMGNLPGLVKLPNSKEVEDVTMGKPPDKKQLVT